LIESLITPANRKYRSILNYEDSGRRVSGPPQNRARIQLTQDEIDEVLELSRRVSQDIGRSILNQVAVRIASVG